MEWKTCHQLYTGIYSNSRNFGRNTTGTDTTNDECATTTLAPKRSVIIGFNVLEVERVADHGAISITVRH